MAIRTPVTRPIRSTRAGAAIITPGGRLHKSQEKLDFVEKVELLEFLAPTGKREVVKRDFALRGRLSCFTFQPEASSNHEELVKPEVRLCRKSRTSWCFPSLDV